MIPAITLGTYPGLTLKAWCLFKVAAGVCTFLKGNNVTNVTRSGVGAYTVTVTAALAGTDQVIDYAIDAGGLFLSASQLGASATVPTFSVKDAAAAAQDVRTMYLAIYE